MRRDTMASFVVVAVILVGSLTNALAYNAPRSTILAEGQEFNGRGWTPAPTSPPRVLHDLLRRGLFDLDARATDTGTTILVAEDQTCGYLSGSAGAAYTCPGTSTCNLFTNVGAIACCGNTQCSANIECMNSVEYWSKSACNDVCEQNTFTLKCTNAAAPYCNTATWPEVGVSDVYCNSRSVSSIQTFSTNYDGQTFGGHFTPEVLTGTDSVTSSTSSSSSSSSSSEPTPDTTTSKPSPTPVTTTITPGPTSSTPPPSKKSTPIGPIVGGVLGGVALLALIGFGLFFILHKKRKSGDNSGPSNVVVPPTYATEIDSYQAHKPPPQMTQQEYYPPVQQQQPVQNQQYAQQISPTEGYYGQPSPGLARKPVSPLGDRSQTTSPTSTQPLSPQPGSPQRGRESYVSAAPAYEIYPENVHEVGGRPIGQGSP